MMNYYDLLQADKFEQLFGDLAIGQNPTPLHNQYLIMKWDFSQIKSHGSIAGIEQALHNHINVKIKNFFWLHRSLIQERSEIHPTDALASFDEFLGLLRGLGHKLYLFIDEYDNFANEVMMGTEGGAGREGEQLYSKLVQGAGLFKTLFKNIKSAGSGEGLDRVFMTGVSPIVMSDITSGNNVTRNVTWHPALNDLCGFRPEEVQEMVERVVAESRLDLTIPVNQPAAMLEAMRLFYDGSRFVLRDLDNFAKLYNPILTFYFLRELQETGQYPKEMLDSVLAPDYYKLVYISSHPAGLELLLDAVNPATPVVVTGTGDRFGVKEMLQPDKQYDRLAALLCYLGGLTVNGETEQAKEVLAIPNLVMRKLYAERILEMTWPDSATRDRAQRAADLLFAQGDPAPLCRLVEEAYFPIYDNRDYKDFSELTLKTLFMALLHYNPVYIMDSEPALHRTYGDLSMLLRPEMRHFKLCDLLFEFKYVPLSKVSLDKKESKKEEKQEEQKSARKKLSGQEVRRMTSEALLAIDEVKVQLEAAKQQLRDYQQILVQKYGNLLKLRTYAVVAVGLERLLWEEVKEM